MRLLILIQLLNVAYGCLDFWKKWTGYRCSTSIDINSEIRCYMTEKLSYAQIYHNYFFVFCKNETIYGQLMRCLEANSTNYVSINDCYMSEFDVGQFVSGVKVVDVLVNRESIVMNNFASATFNDIPTLKTITLIGLRTSGVLNVTFGNVPSVVYLNIENSEFRTFMPSPFQNLSSLSTLSLTNGVLETLPSQVFRGLYNLNRLNLSNNQIKEIDSLLLKNLTQLQVLDLSGNKLTNLPSDLLSDLSNLISFAVYKNRLTALPDNLFAACSKLEYFFVSHNQIGQFPSGFFAGLRNLKYFFAMNCSLTHLERGIFSDATNLRAVVLTTNQIVNLPPDLFKNSKNLEEFFIGVNKIQYLPPGIFDDLINLQHIQLSVNQLRTLPKNIFQNLSSLEVLDLGFNLLTHLPEDVFLPLINLRVLDISRSFFVRLSAKHPFGRSKHLTKISAKFSNFVAWPMINWTEHHSLTFVDFSRSNFNNVTLPLRTPNRAIVDLSDSNIRTIYIDTHEYGSNFPTYDLRNSNITCDCNLRQFVDFLNVNLETAAQIFPNLTNLECYEKKKKLLDITTTYRMCPVTKDCPVDCECFQDFEGILVNCSRKDMRDMPEILIENATVVDLTHNRISNVDPQLCRNVTHLYLSDNSLTSIDNLPPTITYLSLNRNQLTRLPPSLMYRIDNWNEFKILLAGNNWSCGCDSLFTKDWLIRNKHKILDFANVSCRIGSDLSSFVQVISTDKCKEEVIYFTAWKIALVCISLIVFVLVLLIVVIVNVRRLKRIINNSENRSNNAVALYFINRREENVELVKVYCCVRKTRLFELMRLLILIQLLNVAYGCLDFWKKWTGYRCSTSKDINSEIRCYMTEKLSYAQIYHNYFFVFCKNETIYGQLMRCLEANSTNYVSINDCYMSEFDVGQFVSGVKVVDVLVNRESIVMNNFASATFNDIPTLKTITLIGLRTSGVLNVTFGNVPSVVYLNIENSEFRTFMPSPFQNLSSLSTLSLTNGVLETLPSQVFRGLYNLNRLNLSNNQIKEIDSLLLKNLTQLQVLDLSGNKLTNLPSDLLSDLSNLISFVVYKNRLTALPDNLFAACSKLKYFFVGDNQIGQFPSGFFAGLQNLKYFFAINCSLTHLEGGIFSDATNLRKVILTTNQIVNLPPDLFKNSKNLEEFFIGVNKIQHLPPGIFDDLINLQHIQLSVNQLRTLPKNIFQNLSSLEVLDLGSNLLTHLPEDVFLPLINLRVLDISRSSFVRLSAKHPFGRSKHLTKISAKFSNFVAWPMINWTEHHSLTFVDFSRSNFNNVTLPLRTPNRAIVDLSDSNIRTIYIDTHEYGSNFPTYDLRNSNITCDCNLRQFVDFLNVNLETAAQIFPNLTNLECYEKKKKLLDITTTYRMCPVTKDCPVDCECFQDFEGILVNCSRKDMRDMPEILIENATVVDLTHNRISNVDPQLCRNVTHLYLSDNSLTSIDNLPPTITYLSLNRNQLTRLPPSLMYRIDNWNEFKILLAGNNWSCGCDSLFTKDWLIRNKHKILDFANVSCRIGSDLSSFVQVISTDKCKEEVIYFTAWKIALVCISLIVFVLVLLIVVIVNVRRLKRIINNSENRSNNAVALYFINRREENVEVR
ncbi:uncharacterized protein [Centruroides vittatus]|uniref:uncharacterized protein n=1 Tax=Centruroides vittatus TaxID=120091 RepID=UPI0035109152